MPTGPIRVALMDDYEIVVRGLAQMLEPYADRVTVVELDSRKEPVTDFDLLLFDTFGRGTASTDLARVVEQIPGQVVIYSWGDSPELAEAALEEGVAGYLPKSLTAAELVEALEKIHAGVPVSIPGGEETEAPPASPLWPGQEAGLTARESELLGLITQGMSNKQIAEVTYIGDNTVKTHIRSIYRKIGVARRAEAVRWGMENGLEPDRIRIFPGA